MSNQAIRWSGLPLIGGAVLLGVAIILVSLDPQAYGPFSPLTNYCFLLAALLLLLALPGFYARQAKTAGGLGLAGYGLLQIGTVLFILVGAPQLVYPSLTEPIPADALIFCLAIALTLGLLFTAVATLRARVFPRWTGALLLAAMLAFFFAFFISELLPAMPALIGQASMVGLGLLIGLPIVGWGLALLARPAPLPPQGA